MTIESLLYFTGYSVFLLYNNRNHAITTFEEPYQVITIFSILFFIIMLANHIHYNGSLYQILLCCIYLLYSFNDLFLTQDYALQEYSRNVMWFVTSPLMLKQYMKLYKLTYKEIAIYWHTIASFLFCFSSIRTYTFIPLCLIELYVIYTFYNYIHLQHTPICIQVWLLFSVFTCIEYYNICNTKHLLLIYKMLDIIVKGVWLLLMNDKENNKMIPHDVNSLRFIGGIKRYIFDFSQNNNMKGHSTTIMNHITSYLSHHIDDQETEIKVKLLKMILPYDLDTNFLLNNGKTKSYKELVVLMTDIVNYTTLCKTYDESKIYLILNQMYSVFDNRVNNALGIQKIETIGDAYMAVGDLSEKYTIEYVANSMLELAIQFIHDIQLLAKNLSIPISIRIGISCGPVVIGTLGTIIPRLCVIGDTVNVSARLQSSTDPDTIQLSTRCYELLHDTSKTKYNVSFSKKVIDLKHIGMTSTIVCSNKE